MGPERKFGFSRACVGAETDVAVRPRVDFDDECRWVRVVDEQEIVVKGEDEAENLPSEREREMKRLLDPLLPSAREISDHQLSHLPYRSWCPHCVKGRAKEMGHQRLPKTERGLAEFHLDYCFPGDEMGCKLCVLVGVERYSGMKMATVVPTKGATGAFAARKTIE